MNKCVRNETKGGLGEKERKKKSRKSKFSLEAFLPLVIKSVGVFQHHSLRPTSIGVANLKLVT